MAFLGSLPKILGDYKSAAITICWYAYYDVWLLSSYNIP